MEFHPLANIFPLIEGAEFDDLVADIREHGVHEPVWLYQGKILDGRNRHRAAQAAGVECPMRAYEGQDPVAFVVSLNLKRRHLSEGQRAMVAAKIATLQNGQRQVGQLAEVPTQDQAAAMLNVGERSVRRAREVLDEGAPELVKAVERGLVSVSAAADVASKPVERQREIVARGEREILEVARAIRAEKAQARHAERIERLRVLCERNADLPTGRRYPVIYADPPWQFVSYPGGDRTIENHYPVMPTEEICALPISDLATDAAVLFLWSPSSHLPEALQAIQAWGFAYAASIVWVKDKIGLGNFVRNQHELLLIATRGDMPTPLPANRPPSIVQAPRREHSRKPDEAYELIECMYPDLPRIELFARGGRSGWAAWGNQAKTPEPEKEGTAAA